MQTLEIRSPSNVPIEYALAPLSERVLAFFIDLAALVVVVLLTVSTFGRLLRAITGTDQWIEVFLFGFLPIALMIVYFALSEYYFEGRTLGKAALKLRTVRIDGESPTLETFATRAVMQFVDFLLSFGTLGFLAALSSPYRQRIGDRIAQTVVVRANPRTLYQLDDILAIKTVEEHVVRYPGAGTLSTEQALTIKELIVRCDRSPNAEVDRIAADATRSVGARLGADTSRIRPVEFLRQVLRDYIVLTR